MHLRIDTNIQINLYRLLPLGLILIPQVNARADRLLSGVVPQDSVKMTAMSTTAAHVDEGDTVAGFEVTSGYGKRIPPCDGCSSQHYGIDLATPVGTELKAPKPLQIECFWDKGGGGEVASIDYGDAQIRLLHLSSCVPGSYEQGEVFALTGSSGKGTGPHLDVRRADKQEPTLEEIEPFLTGKPIEKPAIATAGLSDELLKCAIGSAEGTVNDDCSPNTHYWGHVDPGNGAANLGAFSYQHGASSPQEADQKQIQRLRNAEQEIQAQARAKWGRSLSKAALVSALDLWNQAPLAGQDFVKHLPTPDPTEQEIIEARAQSFVGPNGLDAPGLGNNISRVKADQERRTKEVMEVIE